MCNADRKLTTVEEVRKRKIPIGPWRWTRAPLFMVALAWRAFISGESEGMAARGRWHTQSWRDTVTESTTHRFTSFYRTALTRCLCWVARAEIEASPPRASSLQPPKLAKIAATLRASCELACVPNSTPSLLHN
jgi:hypothetical protein